MWMQLAIKAAISGVLIAVASEIGRRSPTWGGLLISLPLVSTIALIWLWRDTGNPDAVADMAISSTVYVIGSLPAFIVLALLLRAGFGFFPSLLAGLAAGYVGYFLANSIGEALGIL